MSTMGREADAAWRAARKRKRPTRPDDLREQLAVWRYDLEQRIWRAQLRTACGASHVDFATLADEVSAFAHCLAVLDTQVEQEKAA
jgi:hypothetical protein